MKIIYFHQYFSTPDGSSGTRSYEMAKRAIARGHTVLMICASAVRGHTGLSGPFRRGRRRGLVDGIEVLEFDLAYANRDGFTKRTAAFLAFAFRSIGVALREPYDVLFATTTPLTAGIPAIIARWIRRKPFVFEVRDLWPELPRAMGVIRNPLILGAMSALEWATYRSAHRLVALAPGIVDGIARRGVPRSRISLIPNGCDFGVFDGSAPWRPPGVDPSDLMAIFAGAHGMANGLDAVVDAAVELQRRGSTGIKLVLVGDGKLKPALERRAAAAGLANLVFRDAVSKSRLAGLMASADVGLQILENVPAFFNGTSQNKFFDYLSVGMPVLINYPGWLAALVQDHQCGYAVPPGKPEAMADALEHAAANRAELASMGSRSAQLARSQFDRRHLADAFVDWIEGSVSP